MVVEEQQIPITKAWLEDVLRIRVRKQGIKIEDLFIITRAINNQTEGDTELPTAFGRIKIFFRNDLPKDRLAVICHRSKFDYPKKGQSLDLNGRLQAFTNWRKELEDLATKTVKAPKETVN